MTLFGRASAWAAVVVGILMLGSLGLGPSWVSWTRVITGIFLLIAGVRTLRAMPGGMRLLAAAWGVTVGHLTTPYAYTPDLEQLGVLATVQLVVLPWIALTGLALAVLHEEPRLAKGGRSTIDV